MIPKKIHYIWIGNQMPALHQECISTWSKNAPDFDIEFWNEVRIEAELLPDKFYYTMLKNKKYAFAVDYLRCLILYKFGGIYLDTDMELILDITPLCDNIIFTGLEKDQQISCGIIGAVPKHPLIEKLMSRVIEDGGLNVMPELFTEVVGKQNIRPEFSFEKGTVGDVTIYPLSTFYPYNPYRENSAGQLLFKDIKPDTYAIHHWAKAWKLSFVELIVRRLKKIFGK